MVRKFTSIALAGALMMVVAPAFADGISLNPLGLPLVPNNLGEIPVIGGSGLDLDPLHIFTPAPAPAAAPAAVVHVHHHVVHHHVHHLIHHHVHHVVVHHHVKKK